MLSLFKYGVILSFFFSLVFLSISVLKTFSFGKKTYNAQPRGDWKKGVLYAFGKGLMPWEKESAKKHLPTYVAGIFYHGGIFTSFFYLLSLIFPFRLNTLIIFLVRLLISLGFLGGLGLFLKRIFHVPLRKISCPDDFASNLIVNIFLAFALICTFTWTLIPFFYLIAILMFFYIPLGKIRHCFFFFYIRILFGLFYGRRGVLPKNNITLET